MEEEKEYIVLTSSDSKRLEELVTILSIRLFGDKYYLDAENYYNIVVRASYHNTLEIDVNIWDKLDELEKVKITEYCQGFSDALKVLSM